jgi:sulfonate transport system substrate-binding protein
MKRRDLLQLVPAAALPFLAPARTARAAGPVVRIGWQRAPADLTLGRARGTMEKALAAAGATVEWSGPFAAAAPALEAMNAGAIDITGGSSTACIAALAAEVPFVIFGYQKMSAASQAILVKQDSPIKTLDDLRGHTVAVNRGGTGEYLLMRALARNGVDPSGVKRVYLGPADSGSAFDQGHVDAWATWDPFVLIALHRYDARVLADGDQIGSDNAVTVMASSAFAKDHMNLLQVVFDTVKSDDAWAIEHKDEAGRFWAETMSIPASYGDALGASSAVPTTGVTAADVKQMEQIADWYVESKIIPTRPDISKGVVMLK